MDDHRNDNEETRLLRLHFIPDHLHVCMRSYSLKCINLDRFIFLSIIYHQDDFFASMHGPLNHKLGAKLLSIVQRAFIS